MGDALALALSQYRGFITEICVQDIMHIGDRIHFVFNNGDFRRQVGVLLIDITRKTVRM
ncbi:hypothetical protein [Candidatus Schneideria nysicola]|uniref:hypothetical protein n=1 Tax=Candidatus Schneideria nysicola TaxID=1081631 RepID=UPI001CAA4BA6|nr:hypothetical protein [Candidatus Schneideria nysicola]UAJ65899.1 hypothetical protein KEC38_01870 [Candidatus Schneideria nysicola]